MKTILELLIAGEYKHHVYADFMRQTSTRGLWQGGATVHIPKDETIHGNPIAIDIEWLQVGATGRLIVEDFRFHAHGKSTSIPADRLIEELRKHI